MLLNNTRHFQENPFPLDLDWWQHRSPYNTCHVLANKKSLATTRCDCATLVTMENTFRAAVVLLLLMNIIVAGFMIYAVNRRFRISSHHKKETYWKLDIDKIYTRTMENSKTHPSEDKEDKTSRPSLEFLSLLKPVAHFSGLDLDDLKDDRSRNSSVRNWANSEGSERSLLYNDMIYQYGSITVPTAGVYHINSHVKFYVEDNRKDDNSSQTFQHQIVRYSASSQKQVTLFEIGVTECREGINDGAHLEYPSCTGGLVQLDAGDQIIVRVSRFDLLKHDRDWHYFDIYLI